MSLVAWQRPRIFVELGTFTGVSYCAFCQSIEHLGLDTKAYAVDTWKGDPHNGSNGPEVLEELRAFHDPRYGSFSRLIPSTFDEALLHFLDGSVDLLHIDGYHTHMAVKHDFESWLPKMSHRGVIVFHDINVRQGDFGVWRLWEELKEQFPYFEFLHCHGLGVLQVGKEPTGTLDPLLNAPAQEAVKIRECFSQLGQRLTFQWETERLLRDIRNQQETDRESLQRQLAELQAAKGLQLEEGPKIEIEGVTAIQEQPARVLRLEQRLKIQNERLAALNEQLVELQASKDLQLQECLHAQGELRTAQQRQLDMAEMAREAERAEHRGVLTSLQDRLGETEQNLQVCRLQLAEKNGLIEFQASRIAEKDQLLQSQGAQLAERADRIRVQDPLVQALTGELNACVQREGKLQEEFDGCAQRLEAVQRSLSFRCASRVSRLVRQTAPVGTLRGTVLHLALRGGSVLRRDGVRLFFFKLTRKATTLATRALPFRSA